MATGTSGRQRKLGFDENNPIELLVLEALQPYTSMAA